VISELFVAEQERSFPTEIVFCGEVSNEKKCRRIRNRRFNGTGLQ
jgi:hypothetical protein